MFFSRYSDSKYREDSRRAAEQQGSRSLSGSAGPEESDSKRRAGSPHLSIHASRAGRF